MAGQESDVYWELGEWYPGTVIIKGSNFHLTFVSADFNFQIRPSAEVKKLS